MMIPATVRFRRTKRAIASKDVLLGEGDGLDLALTGLLVALGAALFCTLSYTVVGQMGEP